MWTKAHTNISAPPSPEYISYESIQTAPPAISTWCSPLGTNLFAHQRKEGWGRMHTNTWLFSVTVTPIFNPSHQHHAITWNAMTEKIWKGPTNLHCFLRLWGLNPMGLLSMNYLDIFENHYSKWISRILVLWKLLFFFKLNFLDRVLAIVLLAYWKSKLVFIGFTKAILF